MLKPNREPPNASIARIDGQRISSPMPFKWKCKDKTAPHIKLDKDFS
jgi:hypothetical protein